MWECDSKKLNGHKQQRFSVSAIQGLSLVDRCSRITNHSIKECFGILPGPSKREVHIGTGPGSLRESFADLISNNPFLFPFHKTVSQLWRRTCSRESIIPNDSTPLFRGRLQSSPTSRSCTRASRGIPVIVIPILESLLGEIVPARTWFGILMSVIGICMLECSGSPPNIGDLFNFLSAIFFGIHTLRTEHISRTTTKDNLLPLLGYEVGVVAVLSTVWCLMGSNYDSNEICWTWGLLWDWIVEFPWIPALYTGVFSTGLCLYGEMAAMREVSATETAVIYGMEPLWGAGFAWFMLGERWGMAGWVGAALILGGSLSVQMFGALKEENGEQVMVSDENKFVMVRYRDINNDVMDILNK